MTNNTINYEAFDLSDYFKVAALTGIKGLRIISIAEDGYLNVKTPLPTGPAFVSLYEGEAFLPNGATGKGGELAEMYVVHAGLHGLHGAIEFSGVTVAAVPPTNLTFASERPNLGERYSIRTIGAYTVNDDRAVYWVTTDEDRKVLAH